MGTVCLQGGAEFQPDCRDIDRALLDLAEEARVVIVPLAAAPGRDYDTAGRNGVEYFASLGAADTTVAPDARAHPDAAAAAIRAAGLVFLPGGSPTGLRDALGATGAGAAVRDAATRTGTVVCGASAGAMVLCSWTLLPDGGMRLASGLGVVPDFVVIPHWSGDRPDWVAAVRAQAPVAVDLLGLPECSGVLLDGDSVTAVGAQASTLLPAEGGVLTLALT